jgi:hypothetical protein
MGLIAGLLTAAAAALIGLGSPSNQDIQAACAPRPAGAPFRVFNGMFFAGQPDLRRYGMEPIHIIDRGIWRNEADRRGPPDPAILRQTLARLPDDGAPVVINVENFDPGVADPQASAAALRRLIQIHDAFRAAAPRRALGHYSMLPGRDYWRAVRGPGSPPYRAWQRENDRLRSLEQRVDLIFPSLYAFYNDPASWETFAEAQICEARRLSRKPVYVFLWFEYHPSEQGTGRFIPPDYWRRQLETARRYADGVVIWGGYDIANSRLRTWDPRAPWWRETEAFLSRQRAR